MPHALDTEAARRWVKPGHADQAEIDTIADLELRAVMRSGQAFPAPYLALLLVMAIIMHPALSTLELATWCGVYALYILARTIATNSYAKDPERHQVIRVRQWRRWVALSALVHGCLWGATAFIALPQLSPARQAVLTCMAALFCAGGIIYVSALVWPLMILIHATVMPFLFEWWKLSRSMDAPIFEIAFAAWAINVFLSWHTHASVKAQLRLQVANERLNKELARQNRELEVAANERSRLFAVASHDLRQPVHALGLTLAQINEYDHPRTLRKHLDTLQEANDLVAEMLQELMDLAHLERNEYPLDLKPVALEPILQQLRLSFGSLAEKRDLYLQIGSCPDLYVESDANLLRRIFLNLLSNALKYTQVGTVEISCEADARHVVLHVRDTGIGMPEESIHEMFLDYVRGETSSAHVEGMGLGLAIVRKAADLLKHELSVSSEVGHGTAFSVRMVRASPVWSIAEEEAPERTSEEALILLVEDDSHALDATAGLLRKWGYRVHAGASSEAVRQQLHENDRPVLIISDYQLSTRENGFDAIDFLRAYTGAPTLPALLLTGDIQRMQRIRTQRGNIPLAYKPISPSLLHRQIERLIAVQDPTGSSISERATDGSASAVVRS